MGKGSVLFQCKNGDQRVLPEVYYIPRLCSNIISLGQMTEDGNKVVMTGDFMKVYDRNDTLLMQVRCSPNRLYKMQLETCKPVCLMANLNDPAWLRHTRLGHVNFHALKLMAEKQMAVGLPEITHPNKLCEGCLIAKQTRNPFPAQANFRVEKPLELLHANLCGRITPCTLAGNNYFFLIVDDYSRWMWVYIIKAKSQACSMFKKFKLMVENSSGHKVKMLRTDRGGEFLSNEFTSFCEEWGIKRHLTASYTPQQNGVVERRNRPIMAMARSLLKTMHVPGRF